MNRSVGITRRNFLSQVAAVSSVAATGCITASKPAERGIIDTHTHFYDPTRPKGVPWPPKDDPLLYRPVLPEELKALARPLGVVNTVVVEASPWVEDNQWILDLAAREPFIAAHVGHLKPGQPGFERDLARFAQKPRFCGFRTGLWGMTIDSENAQFVRDLKLAALNNLAVDVLVGPDQLGVVARLAASIPELRMVVDHCANVRIDGQAPPAVWTEGIRKLSPHPNVYMKVSGLVEGTGRTDGKAPADTAYYRPALDTIWASFGEDRVLFGSNWPVSARFASYATVLQIVQQYFEACGTEAARKYFARNAVRAYRLPAT